VYILNELKAKRNIVLEFGCGERKRHTNAISIDDALDYSSVDLVGDVFEIFLS
jgi:hypothetical protein